MPYSSQTAFMPRKLLDLPEFSGRPEEWPVFYTAFTESTATYGYTNFDNNQRLQKCLKGDAREMVKSLLIHPINVSCIIEQLKCRFGRREQLIRSQLLQVKDIAPIPENALSKLIPFATKVKNICVFLQSANADHHLANPMLLDDLISKLPMSKRIEWGRYATTVQPRATTVHFSNWLTSLADVICTIHDESQFASRDTKRRVLLHLDERQQPRKCPICQGQHKPYDCKRLIEASVANRWTEVKSRRLCFACLNAGHTTRDCRQRKICGTGGCNRFHNKLLHETPPVQPPVPSSSSTKNTTQPISTQLSSAPPVNSRQSTDTGAAVLSCAANSKVSKLLFRILPVTVYGRQRHIDTYALLDEGSSITMIDNTLAEELDLRGQQHNLNVQWFGGHSVQEPATLVGLYISGAGMTKKHKMQNVYAVKNLQLPSQSLSPVDLLCDDKRVRQLPVQPQSGAVPRVLIGIDNCHLGIASSTISMRKNGPYAANTELGWVVFGPTSKNMPTPSTCLLVNRSPDETLHKMVADFFEIESFGVRAAARVESEADVRARTILESTTSRIGTRFETGLLWKEDNVRLPDSYNMALKRLVSVEKRMSHDVSFAAAYKLMVASYVEKGYARKLEPSSVASITPRTWYLPHFAVLNPNKPNKLRIVFDAAADVNGVSLNRHLLKGPQEYRPLPSILFHFREGAVGVCGDIKEMFHQVLMRPDDRQAQRFLWRDGDSERQPSVYEMSVMTFGAACSPCAAHYIKTRNALEHRGDNRYTARAIKAILDYHYVDDLVDSFDTPKEAIAVATQVRAIHMDAGFELRNFTTSSSEVVAALGGVDVTKTLGNKEGLMSEKVLGLHWQPTTDCFSFNLKFHNVSEAVVEGNRRPTKRELLSVVMSVFDPPGFLEHFIISAKLLMREVWRHEASWDEPLPDKLAELWERWRKQLPAVTEYAIPRFYFRGGQPE
ncbi:uncharacterized protein LOC118741564 [Rhagoletis pomonella]|uniref:uncharacterized protein LOC118741564 n=1 Tax=Rhagoletis pomonella TaxID=28610 RepID=UPI00177E56CE|nr:uncharacterized protein LOC118741564 [Rhagoletis pomonella]